MHRQGDVPLRLFAMMDIRSCAPGSSVRAVSPGASLPTARRGATIISDFDSTPQARFWAGATEMAKDYSWNISRYVDHGQESFVWTVGERAGKSVASGVELSHAAAIRAAMRTIQQLEHPKKPKYE
jgi:hypothetical protein